MLTTKAPGGGTIPMRVHEVKEKTVIVDLNHPLAGKTLNFDVKIKEVRAAEAKRASAKLERRDDAVLGSPKPSLHDSNTPPLQAVLCIPIFFTAMSSAASVS